MNFKFHKIKLSKLFFSITALFVLIIIGIELNELLSFNRLYELHLEKEKNIGNYRINRLLYEYHDRNGINKSILTNYVFLAYLPLLNGYYYFQDFNAQQTTDFSFFIENIKDTNIGFLLLPDYTNKSILDFVEKNIADSNFIFIFKQDDYTFVKIR